MLPAERQQERHLDASGSRRMPARERSLKNLITVLSVVVSLGACGRSRSDPQSADVDQLFAEWNRTDAPGCAVGVSRNGTVVYTHGYGMANLELGVPITPDTVFALASITKSFTAMSALLAAEQ